MNRLAGVAAGMLLVAVSAFSQDRVELAAFIAIGSLEQDPEPLLADSIVRALRLALRAEGIEALSDTCRISDLGRDGQNLFHTVAFEERPPGKAAAELLLAVVYGLESGGDRVSLNLALYAWPKGKLFRQSYQEGAMDLRFDSYVMEAARKLIAGTDLPAPRRRKAGAASPMDTAFSGGTGAEERLLPTIASPVPDALPETRGRHWEISAGSAPLFPLAKAADFFRLGVSAQTSLLYQLPREPGVFGIGMALGLNRFEASGNIARAETFLFPLEAVLSLNVAAQAALRLSGRAAVGAALMLVDPNDTGYRGKILPSAAAGLGFILELSPATALALHTDFHIFFESQAPIIVLSPQVSLRLRI